MLQWRSGPAFQPANWEPQSIWSWPSSGEQAKDNFFSNGHFIFHYLLTYLSPLRRLAHRAATKSLHLDLSLAIFSMVPQLCCCCSSSFSIVLRHVCLGLPLFLLPSGVQCNATLGMALMSILRTCPIQVHRRLLIMKSMLSCWVMLRRFLFEMILGQNIRRILRRHEVWKVDNLWMSLSVVFQHSAPYSSVESTQLW